MPLHVGAFSRRNLLRAALALGAGGLLPGCARRAITGMSGDGRATLRPDTDHDRWALFSDPHIAAELGRHRGKVNMAGHLRQAVGEVLGASSAPAGLIVNGDCAYRDGQSDDYAAFADLCVKPFADAGIPVHLTLGNHDHRDRFRASLADTPSPAHARPGRSNPAVAERCVSVVEGRHARWFLLDSLYKTGSVSGKIGDEQLDWLSASLAAHDDRPALVMGHHPIDFGPRPFGLTGGLRDGKRLWDVLTSHRHVKGYFFGHTHRWDLGRHHGVYLVNLPTTAWLFDATQPQGWVDARVGSAGVELRLRPVGNTPQSRTESVWLGWA